MQIKIAEVDYRSIDRESFSSLKHLLESVSEYLYQKQNPFKGNARTLLGTAIHMHLQGMADLVKVIPDIKTVLKNGTEGKYNDKTLQDAYIAEQLKANPEFIFVSPTQLKICQDILEKASSLNLLSLINDCEIETAHVFEVDEVKLKGRIDLQGQSIIYDIKTTETSLSKHNFSYHVRDSHYDMQAAMYIEAVRQATGKALPYKVLAVNTKAPYEIKIFKLSDATLRAGYEKLLYCIERYKNMDKYLHEIIEEEI